ncbi:O-methyltransferase, family 3 [Ophiocordyceps sinensis CO18]|uniref:O-methyltransferase, family 3 n=1 Tax=Ophiocordyceps sinensis (strain Co18 / CGMCC 3.14243) TaxID=911162 RepID=T4ZZA8_OPHSC|nr:O-methyltransferase, family 3 [Ophiocordyceps sinensis CO18]
MVVLEVGVFVGFSLAMWANAIGPDGVVTGLEQSAEYAALARERLLKHGYDGCRRSATPGRRALCVDLDSLPTLQLDEPFEIVFIDAQKSGYPDYLATILERSQPGAARRLLRRGGLVVGDNALLSALVVDQSDDNPAAKTLPRETPNWDWEGVRRLEDFNTMMHSHERIEAMLLPVFDGLSMGRLLD